TSGQKLQAEIKLLFSSRCRRLFFFANFCWERASVVCRLKTFEIRKFGPLTNNISLPLTLEAPPMGASHKRNARFTWDSLSWLAKSASEAKLCWAHSLTFSSRLSPGKSNMSEPVISAIVSSGSNDSHRVATGNAYGKENARKSVGEDAADRTPRVSPSFYSVIPGETQSDS